MALVAVCAKGFAAETPEEEITQLEKVNVVAPAAKEESRLQDRAAAISYLPSTSIKAGQIVDVKSLSTTLPNFYNPDYGSRTTSSIYIRGIGSRMDQPAVGLYVNGIPYLNKSAFDFNFSDISSIAVFRGPQGTLYGRNTMAGVISIETQLPDLGLPSTTFELGYGTQNQANASISHYNHIGKVGISANGYFNRNDGYFTNHFDDSKVGGEWNAGGRINLSYKKGQFSSLLSLNYDHTDQDGYAYAQLDSTGKSHGIGYNRSCNYTRDMLTTGLSLEYAFPNVIVGSVTSFQYLDDDMFIDNDFTPRDIFTLEQMQNEKSVTEELVVKTNTRDGKFRHYQFLTGASFFRKNLELDVPVSMEREGIERLIEDNVNNVPALQKMGFSLAIGNNALPIGTNIDYPTSGAAIYHQSTFNLNEKWSVEAGIRADYEKTSIDYASDMETHYTFPPMVNKPQTVRTTLKGEESQDFWEILPKLTLRHKYGKDKMVYASVSKGYKSGGYNTQMMSDILQYQMQKDLKEDLYYHIPEEIEVARKTMYPILMGMEEVNVKKVLEYKPEYSWNYEVGTKLSFGKLSVDGALFLIDCRDQQVTVFSHLGGMGRMMRNAGHTRSIGGEIGGHYKVNNDWDIFGSYGYTNATYKNYQANDSTNYKGNHVPFAPEHTYCMGVNYHHHFEKVGRLTASANFAGAANTYWTDDNRIKEDAYGTLNASLFLTPKGWNKLTIGLWGKNLTDSDFNTFYFENMGNRFVQKGKPLQAGVKATLRL